jgi:hypothetical protein
LALLWWIEGEVIEGFRVRFLEEGEEVVAVGGEMMALLGLHCSEESSW